MTTEITINTKLGQIKGIQRENVLNKKHLFSFQGIPYAAVPTGDLRFKPPQPHPGWSDVLDATKEGGMCAQNDMMITMGPCGSDDCLYLNVYTSELNPGVGKPVMVFIHGGGFTFGHSSTMFYGPDLLVNKDVVLVTINYRVNIFGFLNLGIPDCSGNAGLKDQISALRWVQQNIGDFGGDKNNVTLFGESAGSASVHYLVMSPVTRGLFHKAILQSGNALDSWASQSPEDSAQNGFSVARQLGCECSDPQAVLDFLKSFPALDLIKPQNQSVVTAEKIRKTLVFPFVPSKETVGPIEQRVITDTPDRMIRNNPPSVPFICGLNSQESLLLLKGAASELSKTLDKLENDFERVVPVNMDIEPASSEEKQIARKIKEFFFGDKSVNIETVNHYFDLYSDLMFTLGHYDVIKTYKSSAPGKAYVYLFSFEGALNIFKTLLTQGTNLTLPGACHVDEIGYMFYITMLGLLPEPGSPEEKVSNNVTSLWTNFAKTGVPTTDSFSSWKPCQENDVSYLEMSTDLSVKPGFIFKERHQFWEQLYQAHLPNSKL